MINPKINHNRLDGRIMMKSTVTLAVILMILAFPLIPGTSHCLSRPVPGITDYWCDALNGSDRDGDGSEEKPWRTITYSLKEIPDISYPLVLHLKNGVYNQGLGEIFPITMKNQISIIGEDMYRTIIDASDSGEAVIFCDTLASITLEHLTITGGTGNSIRADYQGGGIHFENANVKIKHCWIKNNSSTGAGGGIYATRSIIKILDCMITDNYTDSYGGGLYCDEGSSLEIANTLIQDNTSKQGGGAIFCQDSDILLTSSEISENRILETALNNGNGGGIYLAGNSHATIDRCKIQDNRTPENGGGIYILGSRTDIYNCLLNKNSAGLAGGAISSWNSAMAHLRFCTMAENEAPRGGALKIGEKSESEVENSILWGNGEDQIEGTAHVTYSDVEGWNGDENDGIISEDPLFTRGPWGDYYLSNINAGQKAQSPCVDAADDLATTLEMHTSTTQTDGIFDSGLADIGYHQPPHIQFYLHSEPEYVLYTGESIAILLDFVKVPPARSVDLYIILADEAGNIYSAPFWENDFIPAVWDLMLPQEISFKDAVLFELSSPSESPPIGFIGAYTIYAAAFLTDSMNLISNIAATSFIASPPPM